MSAEGLQLYQEESPTEKNFKKVSGEIAFASIRLFNVQIEEPASRSTTKTAFVFLAKFAELYYHKIFETRMSRDQKVMTSLPPMEKFPRK